MNRRPVSHRVAAACASMCAGLLLAQAHAPAQAAPPIVLKKQGYFYVGGKYDNPTEPAYMQGQMYVEYQIPLKARKLPLIFIHGGSHTGVGWQTTPDGRPGWADYFVRRGWKVYNVDQPGRGRSNYIPEAYGPLPAPTTPKSAEDRWSASEKGDPATQWEQAFLHTRWPGTGVHGDPYFDQYYAHLMPGIGNQEEITKDAVVALLDKIGPAIIVEHSQPGPATWRIADARPKLVAGVVAVEPSGPPIYDVTGETIARAWGPSSGFLTYDPPAATPEELNVVRQSQPDGPGLIACWLQGGQPRQLPNLKGIPILFLLAESSYHAPYDHCTSKWLTQAGVRNDFLRLTDVGIHGNGHLMLIEENSDQIAGIVERWLERKGLARRAHHDHGHWRNER